MREHQAANDSKPKGPPRVCSGAESDACLTAPQAASLKKLYAGVHDSAGKPVFPGRVPGGETGGNGWGLWITGVAPGTSLMYGFSTQFFSNFVFQDAAWDYRTFQVERDTAVAVSVEELEHLLDSR